MMKYDLQSWIRNFSFDWMAMAIENWNIEYQIGLRVHRSIDWMIPCDFSCFFFIIFSFERFAYVILFAQYVYCVNCKHIVWSICRYWDSIWEVKNNVDFIIHTCIWLMVYGWSNDLLPNKWKLILYRNDLFSYVSCIVWMLDKKFKAMNSILQKMLHWWHENRSWRRRKIEYTLHAHWWALKWSEKKII